MNSEEVLWLEDILSQGERSKCISRILSCGKKDVVSKGDNYTSELSRLTLKVALNSGDVEERSVIYKCLPSTEIRKKCISDSGLFIVERRMYTEVLPKMEKIRKEKETGEPLWGECLGAKGYEIILLEDLAVKGFKMGNRMKGLDYDHCKLVMKSLAKFHSMGAVLREKGELIIADYDRYFLEKNMTLMGAFYTHAFTSLTSLLEDEWKGEWVPYAELLRKKSVTILDDLLALLKIDKSKFLTLNHGDCWVNNVLFKYDADEKPTDLRFIDFQISFYNSVGFDLQYFLSSSTDMDLRPKKTEFVKTYYEFLSHYLEKFGYLGKIPTFDDILNEFNRCRLFGLTVALTLLPLIKLPSKDVPDIEQVLQEYQDSNELKMNSFTNTSEEYTQSIKWIIKDAVENGVI